MNNQQQSEQTARREREREENAWRDIDQAPEQADRRQSVVKTITRSPNGTARRVENLSQVTIPDLWHTAELLRDLAAKATEETNVILVKQDAEVLLGHANRTLLCWHLCHDLKENLEQPELRG